MSNDAKPEAEKEHSAAAVRDELIQNEFVWDSLMSEKDSGKKKKKRVKKKKKVASKKQDPVEVADHLSLLSAAKHICWSGEINHFRDGVLAESHAIFVVFFCLAFPLYQILAMAVAFVAVRRIFAEGVKTTTLTVVLVQLFRSIFIALSRKDDPKDKTPPTLLAMEILDADQVTYFQFVFDAMFALSFAYSWLSIGKNWDAYHGTKMAVLIMLYAMIHNPKFGMVYLFKLRGWL